MSLERGDAPPATEPCIDIAAPTLGEAERRAVEAVLASGEFVKGRRTEAFEAAFAAAHGARHAVATNSGATALLAALLAHGIGRGDEVIVPSFSFFATASCVLGAGAVPVFADIDAATFCLSVEAAEAAITSRTKAVMPVHLFGQPAAMAGFEELCARRGLLLLEDAAQAHGAKVGGRSVGSFGTAAFSFFATKNMTTLEGGMVLTNDASVARRVRMQRNHGRDGGALHEIAGSNFRMSELAAAIGLVQLGRLPDLNARRRENARELGRTLAGVELPREAAGTTHVFHQYTVRVPPGADRDGFVRALNAAGVGARVYYATPIHRQPAILNGGPTARSDLPETERASREVVSLPVHPRLAAADLARIGHTVNRLAAGLA